MQIMHGLDRDGDRLRLFLPQAEVVATQTVLDGISERSASHGFDDGAVAEAHLEQATAALGVAGDGNHSPATADRQGAEQAASEAEVLFFASFITRHSLHSRYFRSVDTSVGASDMPKFAAQKARFPA